MPETNSKTENPKTDRISVTFELFYYKIIDQLVGVLSKSMSGVVNDIVKSWINDHLGELINNYRVDVAGIRHEVQMIDIEKDIEDIKREIKDYLGISTKVRIDDLVESLGINRSSLLKIVKENNKELKAVIDGDYISPK